MLPDKYTFRLIDGYTGQILHEQGDKFSKNDIPSNARVYPFGKDDFLFKHTTVLSVCYCKDCMTNTEFMQAYGII